MSDDNANQRWVGEVNAKLAHLDTLTERVLTRVDSTSHELSSLLGRLEAHSAATSEFTRTTERRLADHENAILELRQLVYKGVAVGTILGATSGTLVAWVLQHAITQ